MIKDPYMSVSVDSGIQSSLSTKISVIVFWFMIIAGMGISFSLLYDREEKITTDYAGRANGLAYDLDSFLYHQALLAPDRVEQELHRLKLQYRAESVDINLNGKSFQQGQRKPDQVLFARTFDFHPKDHQSSDVTGISYISFKPLHEAVAQERKQALIYMGIVLLSFGLLLHWILRKILTQPFQRMVQTAKSITHGETMLRFDEKPTDEFGFLSRFINKALDFITLKQGELREALEKVRQSEASLLAEKTLIQVTLHSIGDAVITTDASGNVQYLNPMAEQLTGWRIDNVRGKPVRQMLQLIDE